jgi:hypothetical protein
MTRSFVPRCPVGNQNLGTGIWSVAPKTSTTNIDLPHYGLSYLFVKPGPTVTSYTFRAVITADI